MNYYSQVTPPGIAGVMRIIKSGIDDPNSEAVGKTKGTAQKFLANHASELPPPIKATIPERRGAIALTPAPSALAYWQYQSSQGNETALALQASSMG